MKLCVAFVLMTIGLSCAAVVNHDGQPGCKTDTELKTVQYRNIWDPTSFWECIDKNVAATTAKCPQETGWLDSKKACVSWNEWMWETPVEPPSRPE